MNPVYYFVVVLLFLQLGAAFTYVFEGDWRHAVYWFAASVILTVVTW